MINTRRVFCALQLLAKELGEDFDHYVSLDRLMESQSLVRAVRPVIESIIESSYRPGFEFEDDYHAAWFMKKHGSWFSWVSDDYPLQEDQWNPAWQRMFLVPSKDHYRAEIAATMQNYDQKVESLISEFNEIKKKGDKREISIASQKVTLFRALGGLPPGPIKGPQHKMAMSTWPNRLEEKLAGFKILKNPASYSKLADRAREYRQERTTGSTPSGWRIISISYHGTIDNPSANNSKSWKERTDRYREHWEWHDVEGVAPPNTTKLTFREPACPELWERKWIKNKISFRP